MADHITFEETERIQREVLAESRWSSFEELDRATYPLQSAFWQEVDRRIDAFGEEEA